MVDDRSSFPGPKPVPFEDLYAELRRLAASQLRRESAGSAKPTSLVHAAWLRWSSSEHEAPRSCEEFLGIMARVMRRVLVDEARARATIKRSGGSATARAAAPGGSSSFAALDLIALDEALRRLDRLHPRQRRVVEMIFFGGMTQPEVAAALDVSERTVRGDWVSAQAWLHAELGVP